MVEDTICQVGRIKEKTSMKQEKYINRQKGVNNLYKDHTVTQINIVYCIRLPTVGGHGTKIEKELNNITGTNKEKYRIIIKCQKRLFHKTMR